MLDVVLLRKFAFIFFFFYDVRMSFVVIISVPLSLPSLENLASYMTENLCGYLEFTLFLKLENHD